MTAKPNRTTVNSEEPARPSRLTRAQRTAILKALSDPTRFELLEKIARSQCPLGCTAAHEALAISPATLSHHIKELQSSGLINVRREGKFAFLSIKPGVLEALSAYLQSLSPTACQPASLLTRLSRSDADSSTNKTQKSTILLNPIAAHNINSIVVKTSK
jgi:ArsR family transcriptional regulator, arsenate/arsenite/antimonite-responsive transcriptional repressor